MATGYLGLLRRRLAQSQVTALLGARQVGKTTLARMVPLVGLDQLKPNR
jgi:hypothetical protein